MKNNNDQQYEIRRAREAVIRRANTDVLVNPQVVEQNSAKLAARPPRKRRINYAKKILKDPLIFDT